MLVGIILGVVISFGCAFALFPRGGGDVIATGSAMALLVIPGGAAFLATSCLARAALRAKRRNRLWLALVVGLLPLVVGVTCFLEVIVGPWASDLQPAGPGFHVLREGLPVLIGASVGASVGFVLARIGRQARDPVAT
jgi:hypothetical protein